LWEDDLQEFIVIIVNLIIRRSYMFIAGLGAIFFGFAIGWIAYRILRLRAGAAGLSDFFTILGVIGGAAVITLFKSDVLFGLYSVGLVIGFFAYFSVGLMLYGKQEVQPWRIEQIPPTPAPAIPSNENLTEVANAEVSSSGTPSIANPLEVANAEVSSSQSSSGTLSNANPPEVGNTKASSRRSKTSNANPPEVGNAS
jgi:hypothetical protein